MFSKNNAQDIFSVYSLYAGHKYVKALGGFEEFLATNPDSASSMNMIGSIHLLLNDRDKAESTYFRLTNELIKQCEYDKALAVLTRLASFSKDKSKIFNLRAEIYRLKGKNRLANRQMLALAEEFRHSGNFQECVKIYTGLANENRQDYRLIRALIHKLIIINGYSSIATILKNNIESGLMPVEEVDDIVMFLLDSHVNPEYVIPFLKDFITRHPSYFDRAEQVMLKYLRSDFDRQFFQDIMAVIDISDASDFVHSLKEYVNNKYLDLHTLMIESYSDNVNMVKGLIFELYVNNNLDIDDVVEIAEKTGNPMAMEETLKLIIKSMNKSDALRYFASLEPLYRAKGHIQRAEEVAVYVKHGAVPENISAFFSAEPEKAEDVEARFDTVVPVEEPSAPVEPEKTVQEQAFELETHSYEQAVDVPVSTAIELDSFNDAQEVSSVSADILLSDDFGSEGASEQSDIFAGLDLVETSAESTGFSGFDDDDTSDVDVSMELSDSDFVTEDTHDEESVHTEALVFDKDELKQASAKDGEDDFFSKEING